MTSTFSVPSLQLVDNMKCRHNLRYLTLRKVQWSTNWSIGFTISNGQSFRAVSKYDFRNSHTFDPDKKIRKVEVTLWKDESGIAKINFHSLQEILVSVGSSNSDGGRVEKF